LIVNQKFKLPPPIAEHGFSALVNIIKYDQYELPDQRTIYLNVLQEANFFDYYNTVEFVIKIMFYPLPIHSMVRLKAMGEGGNQRRSYW
jgi:hypothetical protein